MALIGSVESQMREAILRGTLAPASRLRMEQLKARFDVGFSPIREALSRLIGEGLVELEPNRGFRVAQLSQKDLADVAVTRIAVESAALRRAIALGDDRWEANVVGAMHRYRRSAENPFASDESLLAWEASHDDLHSALIGACASPRLMAMQRRLQDQHLRYRRLIVVPQVSGHVHVEEHEKIVALVLERDAEAAVAELERHMMITVDALSEAQFWETDGAARTP